MLSIKFQSVLVLFALNVVILTSASESSSSKSSNFLNLMHDNELGNSASSESPAVFDAISKLSERRQQTLVKRDLLKRVQVPFKWGKRASLTANTINNQLDQCADLFIILVGPNRAELTRFDQNELKNVFDSCFTIWLDTLFANAKDDSSEDESEQVAKRSNHLPFKWGR